MGSKFDSVWAIDVGNNSLKAIRLTRSHNDEAEVIGFDNIRHGKILTGVGVKETERAENECPLGVISSFPVPMSQRMVWFPSPDARRLP